MFRLTVRRAARISRSDDANSSAGVGSLCASNAGFKADSSAAGVGGALCGLSYASTPDDSGSAERVPDGLVLRWQPRPQLRGISRAANPENSQRVTLTVSCIFGVVHGA